MKLSELKQARKAAADQMQAIYDKTKREARSRNSTEKNRWEQLRAEVKRLDSEIQDLTEMESINKRMMSYEMNESKEERNARSEFNLFKAVREHIAGNLQGLEKEMHDEAAKEFRSSGVELNGLGIPSMAYRTHSRASIATDTPGAVLQDFDEPGLNIIKTPTITDRLEVTRYEGLKGKLNIYSHAELVASYVAEKAALNEPTYSPSKKTIEPRRIGLTKGYTKEHFAQTNQSVMRDFMQDFYDAIRRGVDKDLIAQLIANSALTLTDYEAADTAVNPSKAVFLALESALKTDALSGLSYLTTRGVRGYAKGTPVFTNSGVALWTDSNEVNGYRALASDFVPSDLGTGSNQHAVIFGAWSQAVIGQWGAMEMIVDPYTGKKTGEVEVTVNGLFDAGIKNNDSFRTVQNLSIV